MKKNISIAIVIMTALITGCGNNEQTAAPTVIEDQVTVVDNEPDIEEDNESVDDTEPVEAVPETPVVTGRVNRDDYWEGDTFHLDDYAAALGYNHVEGVNSFSFKYKGSDGKVSSYVLIGIRPYDTSIECYNGQNELTGELSYMYHGEHSGRTANIEYDNNIWSTGDRNSIESRIDTFDHFAYDASDALDWDGLENWD